MAEEQLSRVTLATSSKEELNKLDAFEKEIRSLINRHGMDARCRTPDFILAGHVRAMLLNYAYITEQREDWFGRDEMGRPKKKD